MIKVLVSIHKACETSQPKETPSGFYKSSYIDDSGERRYMALTQMEPVDARRVSPIPDLIMGERLAS
jgi:hypothetical protein